MSVKQIAKIAAVALAAVAIGKRLPVVKEYI